MAGWRIVEQAASTIHLEIQTSRGPLEIMAEVFWSESGKDLILGQAHVEGAGAGELGRVGLNEAKRELAKFGRHHRAERILFRGGKRTSGRLRGKRPKLIYISCV